MEDYLGPVKTKKDDLFLKLVKKVSKSDYTMHFMEDRNGRKGITISSMNQTILKLTYFWRTK